MYLVLFLKSGATQGTRMEYATRERFGWLSFKTIRWTVSRFWPQNPGAVSAGIGGGTWRHRKACIEAKLSHEGHVVVESTEIMLDHNALRQGGSL